MIRFSGSKMGRLVLGSTEIAKAYLGTTLVFQKSSPQPAIEVINVYNYFGTQWPYSDYYYMYQSRIVVGSGQTINSYSFINNQTSVGYCGIIKGEIPTPMAESQTVRFTVAGENHSSGIVTEPYPNSLGVTLYKHTITLPTPLVLSSGEKYEFIIRSCGGSFTNLTRVALNASQGASYGACFSQDLSNHVTAGDYWDTWYESKFVHEIDHPYYLELNGIPV